MFETSIFCDKCGCGFSFPNVEPKWFMTKIARQKDGLLGKGIYALVAIIRTEGKVSRMSEICDKCLTCHWYCDDVLEECKGQEEPCHEYSPCMEIRRVGEPNGQSKRKIHDACLNHESEILDLVGDLGNQRNKNYETGRIEDIDLMIPILNGISDEVERYKEYIQEVIKENE